MRNDGCRRAVRKEEGETMAREPTKRIEMDMSSDDSVRLETTYEHLNSVELGHDRQGRRPDQVGEGLRGSRQT